MPPDGFANWPALISDVAVAISAVVVAVAAIWGLQTWRRELAGKAKFETARRLVTLGLRFKHHYMLAREPGGSSAEYIARPRKEGESDAEASALDEWYARGKRVEPLAQDLQQMQEANWEIEVLLPEGVSRQTTEALAELRKCYGTLASAVYSYFSIQHDQAGHRYDVRREADPDWLESLRRVIYGSDDDELAQRVAKAVDSVQAVLKLRWTPEIGQVVKRESCPLD